MGQGADGNSGTDFIRSIVGGGDDTAPPQQDSAALPLDPITPTQGQGEPGQAPTFKEMGSAAATADFQAGIGKGWEYDPDAMLAQIKRLKSMVDGKLRDMSTNLDLLTGIVAPGAEQVSRDFTDVANPSGGSHNTQFDRYKTYLQGYIEALEKIDKAYQEQDQATLDALRRKDV